MKKFFGIILGVICAVLFVELALRILPCANLHQSSSEANKYEAKTTPPNQNFLYTKGWMFQIGNRVCTNQAGFYSPTEYVPCPKNDGLAFIGDSLVESIMVDRKKLFHVVLGKMLLEQGVNIGTYSFGRAGNGLADAVNLMRLAKDKFSVKNFIIKIDHQDFIDDKFFKPGHFYYDLKKDDTAEIKTRKRQSHLEILRKIAIVRYFIINLELPPSAIIAKVRSLMFSKSPIKESVEVKQHTFSDVDKKLLKCFVKDVLVILENDKSKVLFLVGAKDAQLNEILTSVGFQTLNVSECTKSQKSYESSCFYNDPHWNQRGIIRICEGIKTTNFFKGIIERNIQKNK